MGLIANTTTEEWYGSMPRPAGIYRLIDKTMNDHSLQERTWAVIALGESRDPRAVHPLIDCCRDKHEELRWHAIGALEMIRSGRGVDVLIERLRDTRERERVRARAATALASIGSLSAIEGLKATLEAEAECSVLRAVITSLLARTHAD